MNALNFLIVLFTIFTYGCGEADFTKFSRLGGLRMVGIEASVPEVDGTATGNVSVTLTPYISDIDAGGRTFNVTVFSCLDSGITRGGEPDCENPTTETSTTFDTSTLSADNYTGSMGGYSITISNPASLIEDYSEQQRFNGVNYLVIFQLQQGGETFRAVKAIPISERTTANSNPTIQNITFNEAALSNSPTSQGTLDMTLSAGAETYEVMRGDGTKTTKTENLLISWFVSKGAVQPARIVESQSSTYYPSEDTSITLIGVVRDRRGGTDVVVLSP